MESLRQKFYNKLAKEYEEYEEQLKELPKEEIIKKSYETAIKNEMTYYFDPGSEYFNEKQLKVLNKLEKPMDEIYQDWIHNDFGIGEDIRLSIDEFSYSLIEHEKQKKEITIDER